MSADISFLSQYLSKQCKVENDENILSFEGRGLKLDTADDAKHVVSEIEANTLCTTMILKGNTINIPAAEKIAQALEKCNKLKRALWSDMFTGRSKKESPPALQLMCDALMRARVQLTEFDLSDNAFGPAGANAIEAFLKSPSAFTLEILKLNNQGLGIFGGRTIAECLISCHSESKKTGKPLSLKIFVAGRNRLENEGASALAAAFKAIGTLEEVTMPQNGIYHLGISALAEAFASNPNMQRINLEDNTLTELGAKAISEILPKLPKLKLLNLNDCLIRRQGAVILAKSLKKCCNEIETVQLCGNEITATAALELGKALIRKKDLKMFDIGSNNIGESGIESLESLFATNNIKEALQFSDEDQGELSDEEFQQVDVEENEETYEDEDEEETYAEEDDVSEDTWKIVDYFLEMLEEELLCELDADAPYLITQRIRDQLDNPYYTIKMLFGIASLITEESDPKVKDLAVQTCQEILRTQSCAGFINVLCQKLGLIKQEDGKIVKPTNFYGILEVLRSEYYEDSGYFHSSIDVIRFLAEKQINTTNVNDKGVWRNFLTSLSAE